MRKYIKSKYFSAMLSAGHTLLWGTIYIPFAYIRGMINMINVIVFYCSFEKSEGNSLHDTIHQLDSIDHLKEFEKLNQLLPYNDDIFNHFDFQPELPDIDNDLFFYPQR